MILDAIIDGLGAALRFVLSLFGSFTLPQWVEDLAGFVAYGFEGIAVLAWWLPLDAMVNSAAFLLLCTTVGWTVYLVRVIASFFTGGGGKA